MNVVLYKNNFYIENVNLLKKKINTVIEGIFTKFIYSNEFCIMNGLYLEFPIYNMSISNDNRYTTIGYKPYDKENLSYLQYISSIELKLLEYYNKVNNIHKRANTILSKKLYSGNIKICLNTISKRMNDIITIKISGIWETEYEVGLATKIIYNTDF